MDTITYQIFHSVGLNMLDKLYYPMGRLSFGHKVDTDLIFQIKKRTQYVVADITSPIREPNTNKIYKSISETFRK